MSRQIYNGALSTPLCISTIHYVYKGEMLCKCQYVYLQHIQGCSLHANIYTVCKCKLHTTMLYTRHCVNPHTCQNVYNLHYILYEIALGHNTMYICTIYKDAPYTPVCISTRCSVFNVLRNLSRMLNIQQEVVDIYTTYVHSKHRLRDSTVGIYVHVSLIGERVGVRPN
jgi:hypothetical protein